MSTAAALLRAPAAALEFANVLLTRDAAPLGQTPRDVVWTHRSATLYRYRSEQRSHAIALLLHGELRLRAGRVDLEDVTHFDRPGGHIGLVAGSRARQELWPDLCDWLAERSVH
jgi:polyhydroxyalkanoate synthase subunit PhaC